MRMAHHETTMAICAKCQRLQGLQGKGQAVSRKELSNKKCTPEVIFYSKTILVSCKETFNCNGYIYIVSFATLPTFHELVIFSCKTDLS